MICFLNILVILLIPIRIFPNIGGNNIRSNSRVLSLRRNSVDSEVILMGDFRLTRIYNAFNPNEN